MSGKAKTRPDIEKLQAEDLKVLEAIINDAGTPASVRIQAIQCREKIVSAVRKENPENNPQQQRLDAIIKHIRNT